ncbi:MAG TPA: tRNA-dihydrouridine synthase family protein, partial [Chthoniobacterales bacterium]|nr:tRNA-dihydrouridine synthase family protein [Chthoniobacterales bacterium]
MMKSSLPWFENRFPLYLAPMAGVSDKIFRQLCKEYGADVLTTEFVSAEGIFRRNQRTREYLDFDEIERPIGVQLFGGDAEHMAEAARQVVDLVRPDFVDLNFGCPVNKVVCKNGGSALLKDYGTLSRVADAVVRAIAPLPVTAKIRIGWDADSINAVQVAQILKNCGIAALTVHGRTRAQGYSGSADWDVIGEVAA